jgi:hypothetical protein
VSDQTARNKFFLKEGIMSDFPLLAPAVSTLLGLYCVIWALVSSPVSTTYRIDAVLVGVLLLLLALAYVRVINPQEQGESTRTDRVK